MEWMLLPFKRYADFSGRSRRKEYWMFFLLIIAAYFVIAIVGSILGETAMSVLLLIFALGVIVPSLAVQVRRFHDQDKSGWFVLLGFIPLVGGLIVLVFMCLEGTNGPNQYGPDPKGVGDPGTFE